MHNNDIYTYIRSQGDILSTPEIGKQAIFFTTKESPKVRLQPQNRLGMTVSKYGTLIMQSSTWRQTATNSNKQSGCIFAHSSLRQYRARY